MYIKSTQSNCMGYNQKVTTGEGYNGTTQQWDTPQEIDGFWYVEVHDNYPTNLPTVEEKPQQEFEL